MLQISQSDIVRVRRAHWRVAGIRVYERCQVLTLTGIGPTNSGTERCVLAPFDVVERVVRRPVPVRITRRLWRRACRALVASDVPPGALRAARQARIELLPHQLEPALAVVNGLGSRVLLADDVGLGKTIQAGLILAELRALGVADRILIVTPAGLRDQWARELAERFDIAAEVLDLRAARRLTAALPVGIGPWQAAPVAVASVDYIKRPEVLAAARACRWDVLVVDEAHGVAGDSDRQGAVATVASRASYVVLATATPHSGDRRAFAALCGVGARTGDRLLVFRRTRRDVPPGPPRRVRQLHVRMSRDEARMHALLAEYSRAVRRDRRAAGRPAHRTGASPESVDDNAYWLAVSVLHKRALSSARSLQHSVDRRLARLASRDEDGGQLDLPLGDGGGELSVGDEAPAWSPVLSLRDAGREQRLLRALAGAAARASASETKIGALARLLRRVKEPALVFTEYRDTLEHLQACLGLPAVTLHGGMTRDERHQAVERFTSGRARLLLATDAAGEGLNLQKTCRLVVNLELPWNPVRLEQRLGRVDRIGQRRTVHAVHLIARDSDESRVLSRLLARIATARADLSRIDSPAWGDEGAVARLIVGHVADAPKAGASEAAPPACTLLTPRLQADARAEAGRIAGLRLITTSGDDRALTRPEGLGPCTTAARHPRTRAALGGRVLLLWRVAAQDGWNRPIASKLVALTADPPLDPGDSLLQRAVDRSAEAWRRRVVSVHDMFLGAALARERASEAPSRVGVVQPGLFDRRAERARVAFAAAGAAAAHERDERIASLERARTLSFPAPQLLLVLTP